MARPTRKHSILRLFDSPQAAQFQAAIAGTVGGDFHVTPAERIGDVHVFRVDGPGDRGLLLELADSALGMASTSTASRFTTDTRAYRFSNGPNWLLTVGTPTWLRLSRETGRCWICPRSDATHCATSCPVRWRERETNAARASSAWRATGRCGRHCRWAG